MKPDERQAFGQFLTGALGFWGQSVNAFSLNVWWQACESMTFDQVREAFTQHALDPDRGQFAPRPADLIRQMHGTHSDRALAAWAKVYEAMQRVGARQSVVFDDPAIHTAVMDLGGWTTICRSDVDELQWLTKRFIESYLSAVRMKREHPRRLMGEHEAENRLRGYEVAPPVLVGDEKKALEVMGAELDGIDIRRLSH